MQVMLPQLNLDLPKSNAMTVDEIAHALRVSSSSVRNWVKTGYLKLSGDKNISKDSFESFKKSVVGTEKLTMRANKLNRDSHDHKDVRAKILNFTNNKNELNKLGCLYENSLSNSYRNKEGIYYTPADIVNEFFTFIKTDVGNLIFCDPCCGSGNFIIAALKKGFLPENIYGFDIDPIAVEITKARIKEKTGIENPNIFQADFLHDIIISKKIEVPSFDIIFTNPPWGKKNNSETKIELAKAFNCEKSIDTSALFFRAALEVSNANGLVGMLLPESFFNIGTFKQTRKIILQQNILGFIDFGKPFKTLLTKAQGVVVQKAKSNSNNKILCRVSGENYFRQHDSFLANPNYIFNFACKADACDVIKHLYKKPHITLKGRAKWGLGIVTGNNKKFLTSEAKSGYVPIFRGCEIAAGKMASAKYHVPSDLSLYQQVASEQMYFASTKLIYRFISSNLVFHYDVEKKLILNSANMLVLKNDSGITHKNLAWLLNTNLMNWLFQNIFATHKVLRSDIEALPIFADFFTSCFTGAKTISEENLLDYLEVEETKNGTYRIKK